MADSSDNTSLSVNKKDSTNSNDEIYHHQGGNMPEHSVHDDSVFSEEKVHEYWRENIRLLVKLLIVWFVVSFGFGILMVDFLNQYSLFGMKLGFWFAQQGAIYVFIALIFIYVVQIKKIEQRFGVDDETNPPTNNNEES